jgi:hypothetical protein
LSIAEGKYMPEGSDGNPEFLVSLQSSLSDEEFWNEDINSCIIFATSIAAS